MTPLAAYVLLFVAVGVAFVLVNLLVGWIIRPARPDAEKGTIYECGEPTVGSAWVQFDLRYYVVALLFVVFDVEVAFFFPWAEVFGKANALANVPAQLKTAADYNDLGKKARELASFSAIRESQRPSGRPGGGLEYARFEGLTKLKPEHLEVYEKLGKDVKTALSVLPREEYEALQGLNLAQVEAVAGVVTKLDALLQTQAKEQEKLAQEQAKGLGKLKGDPKGGPPPNPVEVARRYPDYLRLRTLAALTRVGPGDVTILREVPPGNVAALRKTAPTAVKAIDDLAGKQAKEVSAFAVAALDRLRGEMKGQDTFLGKTTVAQLSPFRDLTASQALRALAIPQDALRGLAPDVGKKVREEAGGLAWLALGELLVFFGVLLVGFAYLWRRGDLAWVKTVGERPVVTSTGKKEARQAASAS